VLEHYFSKFLVFLFNYYKDHDEPFIELKKYNYDVPNHIDATKRVQGIHKVVLLEDAPQLFSFSCVSIISSLNLVQRDPHQNVADILHQNAQNVEVHHHLHNVVNPVAEQAVAHSPWGQ
jgi:hypothetical protein